MNKKIKLIVITFIIFNMIVLTFSFAQTNEKVLTYDEALKLSLKNDFDLIKLKLENEKLIIENDNSLEQLGNSLSNPMLLRAYLLDAERNMSNDSTKKAQDFKIASIAYDLKKIFVNIDLLLKEETLIEAKIENLINKNNVISIKYKYGIESMTNKNALQMELNQALKEKETIDKKISDSYIQLNKYLGRDWNDRYPLEKIDYSFIKINDDKSDVDTRIIKALNYDYNLFLVKQVSEIKQKQLDLFALNYIESIQPIPQNAPQPYAALEIDNTIANNTVLDVKQKVSNAVVSKYQALKSMETTREELLIEKNKLEEKKRILEVSISTGMGVKNDLNDLILGIQTIDLNITKIDAQYSLLKENYETPILATYQ